MINKKMDSEFPEPAGLIKKILEVNNVKYAENSEVESAVNLVIMDNEKAVKDFKSGNGNVIGFLIGMVQKRLEGKGNPRIVSRRAFKKTRQWVNLFTFMFTRNIRFWMD